MSTGDICIHDSTKIIDVQLVKNYEMHDCQTVRLSVQGENHAETMYARNKNINGTIKRIDKERYVVMSTGEIKEYQNNDNNQKNIHNLVKTFAKLKALIRTNYSEDGHNQLFITLTYKHNMTDTSQLYKDFDKYMKRLKYAYADHVLNYIAVAEPQERGAWHFHVMLKSDKPILYIDNKEMTEIWRNGMTKTERLKSDDIGQYYVSYFTDLIGEGNDKKKQKRARLLMYPLNFKFYRYSRGIKQPEITEVEWRDVVKIYGKPIYDVAYHIQEIDLVSGDVKDVNTIHKASFRRKGNKREEEREKRKREKSHETNIARKSLILR